MTKHTVHMSDLSQQVAQKLGIPHTKSREYLSTLLNVIQENLQQDNVVQIRGFFKISPVTIAARSYTAQYAAAPVVVPEHNGLRFNISRSFIKTLN